jgi:hypothetical protein
MNEDLTTAMDLIDQLVKTPELTSINVSDETIIVLINVGRFQNDMKNKYQKDS